MPYYHKQYMEHKKKEERVQREYKRKKDEGEEMTAEELAMFKDLSMGSSEKERSAEEQAATARNLKPHSRSTIQLQHIISMPPEKSEDSKESSSKKTRTRWQFGIRSRNLPHEAMHCVYKALHAQGARWEVPKPKAIPAGLEPSTYPVHVEGATHLTESMSRRSDSPNNPRLKHSDSAGSDASTDTESGQGYNQDYKTSNSLGPNYDGGNDAPPRGNAFIMSNSDDSDTEDDDDVDPNVIPDGYIPKDPWCIKVRWLKTGMYPPGTIHPSSANTSRIDLSTGALPSSDAFTQRPASIVGSIPSATTSATSILAPSTPPTLAQGAENGCYVYMVVQLYTLEVGTDKHSGTYLVDFKCAGYEGLVEEAVSDTERILKGSGVRVLDKDVTSPQPFLDLTNRLVIHLAGGGG